MKKASQTKTKEWNTNLIIITCIKREKTVSKMDNLKAHKQWAYLVLRTHIIITLLLLCVNISQIFWIDMRTRATLKDCKEGWKAPSSIMYKNKRHKQSVEIKRDTESDTCEGSVSRGTSRKCAYTGCGYTGSPVIVRLHCHVGQCCSQQRTQELPKLLHLLKVKHRKVSGTHHSVNSSSWKYTQTNRTGLCTPPK